MSWFRCFAMLVALAGLLAMGGGATAPAPRLEGTSWRLQAWSISSLPASDFTLTARFADGDVSGRSAVNTYSAPVTHGHGNTLAVGPVVLTRMAGPEPAMRAESAFLALLGDARSWRIDGRHLILFDAGGNERLVFARSDD